MRIWGKESPEWGWGGKTWRHCPGFVIRFGHGRMPKKDMGVKNNCASQILQSSWPTKWFQNVLPETREKGREEEKGMGKGRRGYDDGNGDERLNSDIQDERER